MKRALVTVTSLALCCLTASAAVCREYGCGRYANPNGWCALHQPEGQRYRARKAAELAEDRRVLREHRELVRQHDAEDAAVMSNELARLKKIEQWRFREMKAEKEKFAQPLNGLFGRKFGERMPAGVVGFAPDEPFRRFVGYGVCSDATNGVVRIFAHARLADEKSAVAERDAVLADLGARFGRTPYKIFTKSGSDVRALGFGGADGLVRQQLEVSTEKTEDGWRVNLVAFVLVKPQRTLVGESEQFGQ